MYSAIRMFDLLRLYRQVAHSRCQFLEDSFHEARPAGCGASGIKLGLLIEGHPVEKPWIRIVLDADFDIHEHTTPKEGGTMSNAFLG
jgi:hypothetical protein